MTVAAYVLWRLNWIHPFINGNGRTARVTCYYILCLKMGGILPGSRILPELIRENRPAHITALKAVDASVAAEQLDVTPLQNLLTELVTQQIESANTPANATAAPTDSDNPTPAPNADATPNGDAVDNALEES